jgi:hypothetical protein
MIGNARKIRNGTWDGHPGTYWAWPVDGYWDIHFTDRGVEYPDGCEVLSEFHPTLAEVRQWVREVIELERWVA